jgi:hypothetical protein
VIEVDPGPAETAAARPRRYFDDVGVARVLRVVTAFEGDVLHPYIGSPYLKLLALQRDARTGRCLAGNRHVIVVHEQGGG